MGKKGEKLSFLGEEIHKKFSEYLNDAESGRHFMTSCK